MNTYFTEMCQNDFYSILICPDTDKDFERRC